MLVLDFKFYPLEEYQNESKRLLFNLNTGVLSPFSFYLNEDELCYETNLEREMIAKLTGFNDYKQAYSCSGKVMVDLDKQKLTLTIYSDWGYSLREETYVLFITDVGNTQVEIPYRNVLDYLEAQSNILKDYLTDESIPVWEEFIQYAFAEFEKTSGIQEFALCYDRLTDIEPDIEWDDLKYYRRNAQESLQELVRGNKAIATDASIAEMERILNEAMEELNTTNGLKIFEVLHIYGEKLQDALEIDPVKEALQIAREQSISGIYFFYDMFLDYIYYFEGPDITEVRDRYLKQVEESTDLEEIAGLPDDFYNELTEMDLVYNEILDEEKRNIVNEVVYFRNAIDWDLTKKYEDVYKNAIDKLNAEKNLFKLEDHFEEYKNLILSGLREDYRELAEGKYDEFKEIVTDEDLQNLDNLYNQFLTKLETLTFPDKFTYEFYVFEYYLNFLETDALKTNRRYCLNFLEELFQGLALTATAESFAALELAYEEKKLTLTAAATEVELTNVFEAAVTELQQLYVGDEAKIFRVEYIGIAVGVMERTIDIYYSIYEYYTFYKEVKEHTENYIALIETAASKEEAEQIYQEWFSTLVEMPFIIWGSRFYSTRENLVIELTDMLDFYLDPASEDYQTLFALIQEIETTYYLPTIIENYFEFQLGINKHIG